MIKANEITRDKILAMDELDLSAAVAEHIMGVSLEIPKGYKGVEVVWSDGRQTIMPMPYASTISSSWEVMEHMSKRHFCEVAMTELDDGSWGWMARFILVINEPYTVKGYRATAKTVQEAICKAALITTFDA